MKKLKIIVREFFFWEGVLIYLLLTLYGLFTGETLAKTDVGAIAWSIAVLLPFLLSALVHFQIEFRGKNE